MVHRTRQRLERSLDDVMRVAAAHQVEVQVHADLVGQRFHEVVDQLGLEIAYPLLADRHVVAEVRAAADIDNRRADRLILRHGRRPEALVSCAVAESLSKCPAHDHPDVLDRVMVIYMQIAGGLDLQVEESVASEALDHVIEERHPGFCLAAPCPVELERNSHRSLARLTLDLGSPLRLGRRQVRDWPRGLFFILQSDFSFVLHFDSALPGFHQPRRSGVPLRARDPRTLPSAPGARRSVRAPQSRPSTPRLYWFVSGNRMHPAATRNARLLPSAIRDWALQGSRPAARASAAREKPRPRL